ncbi:hypothetical protein BK120_33755 [Paenibacillus sp. FSL A5-0031]|uniref:hypothetical protein n=1 Tax=Paenibacillus sp. FSL A5-0031 TaxID=1920420 RepID=UPI00096C0BDF|nr:hypothetical protein [Paenibacillus sp. FSL A5-0031]OME70120.1 hypothetical protein BK120_33755 [Paenibacillus sp. FSL A5-0031]
MKDLFLNVYGTNYTASGKPNRLGDWVLKVETPRKVLDRINSGELVPKNFLNDKESSQYSFYVTSDDLPLCDFLRDMFEEKGISLSLCQVMDIWSEHSEDLSATWLGLDGTPFEELNAIREELISGARSSMYRDNPW